MCARLRESHDVSLASVFQCFISPGFIPLREILHQVVFRAAADCGSLHFILHFLIWPHLDYICSTMSSGRIWTLKFELLKRDHAGGQLQPELHALRRFDVTLGRYARLFLAIVCGDPGNNASTSNVNIVVGFPRRRPLTGAQRQLVALARFDAVQRQLTHQN